MPCYQPFRDDSAQLLLFKIASCLEASGGGGVLSFNGRIGDVVLTLADVAAVADDIYVNESGDSMTGALAMPAGSAALPSNTFSGDLDTGMYSPGADSVGFSTGGTLRLTIASTAVTSTVPILLPDGTAALPALAFQSDTNIGIYRIAADTLGFSTAGTERMLIDSSGLVGIGVMPSNLLTVGGILKVGVSISVATSALTVETTTVVPMVAGTQVGGIAMVNDDTRQYGLFAGVDSSGDSWIQCGRNNAVTYYNLLLQVNGGNVGIGTTVTTSGKLVISGGNLSLLAASSLSFASGANQRAGNAVLVGGTITVANTTVTANTVILLTRKISGGTIGFAVTYTVVAGVSFTINSDNALDTSTYSYLLIEVP